MANFRLIKMQAVVETVPMLLLEGQVEGVADELRDRLRALDLTILSVQSTDASPPRSEAPDDDPWSIHGKPSLTNSSVALD